MEIERLSLKSAASQLNVSVTSLHNWIKEGTLKTTDGHLTQKNINDFIRDYLNNNKLSSRANKQYKDLHNHDSLTEIINSAVDSTMSGKDVSDKYESLLSDSHKNKEGIYYTPQYIVEDMMRDLTDVKEKTFLDPCCGSGNFLFEAIKRGFNPENVYGFDVDENAVRIAKKRIKELCGCVNPKIFCLDFLNLLSSDDEQPSSSLASLKFDYIFTNPPWGKKINKKDKRKYSQIFDSGNSADTSALFYFASLKMMKENAVIAFLLPDSFYNISSFEDARKSLLKLEINRLIDYGKAFPTLMTKAMAFVGKLKTTSLSHDASDNFISCETYNVKKYLRSQNGFYDIPKHILNFHIDEKSNELIRKVFQCPHLTLKNNVRWALGIITGNNDGICHKEKRAGEVPIFRGKDVFSDRLAEPELFIDASLESCRQVADVTLYKAKEKMIYRFISDRIVCYHDTEQHYVLNSANIFVLPDDFPLTYRQLADLLNSDFMNWLFKSIFNTHKILRGDLELLPIWHEYFKRYEHFSEETLRDYLLDY